MLRNCLYLIFLSVTFLSCGGETTNPTTPGSAVKADTIAPPADLPRGGSTLIAWVDRLNVRDAPSSSGKVVATLPEKATLTTTGEVSSSEQTVLLRGVVYREPWYEVTTAEGVTGWVFGGAVKAEGEEKGNPAISADRFTLPYFGTFNLSEWEKLEDRETEGGDATTRLRRYRRGPRTLELEEVSVGEYGYQNNYRLLLDGRPQLTRRFAFVVDTDGQDFYNYLTESVVNHLAEPPVEHYRRQEAGEHYVEMGGRPVMANGPWEERPYPSEPEE